MENSIFHTLKKLGLTSDETKKLFNVGTRDLKNINVWKDDLSGVIFIDDFYTGDDVYKGGTYRKDLPNQMIDHERYIDAQRRYHSNLQYCSGKKLLDFGCGLGDFLKLIKDHCVEITGVELQEDHVNNLNSYGIKCLNDIDLVEDDSIEVCVSFHVIEHLPDPIRTLKVIKKKIVKGGTLIVEVPHANDFLLSSLKEENFKKFTLWSQHLILHTKDSLERLLRHVGFCDISINGVQRYPLSNHLNWLANGKPGGHKSTLSVIDSPTFKNAYSDSLSRINATDTIVAIAKVQ